MARKLNMINGPNILQQMSNTSIKGIALLRILRWVIGKKREVKIRVECLCYDNRILSSPKMRREILDWNCFVKAALGNYFRGWGSARIDIAMLEVLQRMTKKDMVVGWVSEKGLDAL